MEEVVNKEYISKIHFKNRLWSNQIVFYKEELSIFQERLEEVAIKNTGQEVHMGIEQFQNRFIIQRNELDDLKHWINVSEDNLVALAKNGQKRADCDTEEDDGVIEDRMNQFVKLYDELKSDFEEFLIKWM